MRQVGSILLGVVGALVALFTLQNLQMSSVNFLTWSIQLPMALLTASVFGLGLLTGFLLALLLRWRRAGRPPATPSS